MNQWIILFIARFTKYITLELRHPFLIAFIFNRFSITPHWLITLFWMHLGFGFKSQRVSLPLSKSHRSVDAFFSTREHPSSDVIVYIRLQAYCRCSFQTNGAILVNYSRGKIVVFEGDTAWLSGSSMWPHSRGQRCTLHLLHRLYNRATPPSC